MRPRIPSERLVKNANGRNRYDGRIMRYETGQKVLQIGHADVLPALSPS